MKLVFLVSIYLVSTGAGEEESLMLSNLPNPA
jgi:hypothetical protein